MNPKIEQAYGTLELLIEKLSFDLPGHEDGGYIYPFSWEEETLGEFNIFSLCQNNNWLKITDTDNVIKSWRQLEYARYFDNSVLTTDKINNWESNIDSLEQMISDLDNLESYMFQNSSYGSNPNIILGQIEDNTWIGIAPTIYVETNIPHEIITRYSRHEKNTMNDYGEKALEFNMKITPIISQLGTMEFNGDFGGGYYYSYTHQIVHGFGSTKKLAFKNTIQKTGMLEISKFDGLYRDRQYLDNWYCDYNTQETYQKYNRFNQFLKQNFDDVKVYRLASWITENIYIIGQINQSDRSNSCKHNHVGIYIKSSFVYNP